MASISGLVSSVVEGGHPSHRQSYWASLHSMGGTGMQPPSLHDIILGEHGPAYLIYFLLFFIGICVMLPSILTKQSAFLIAGSATIVGSPLLDLAYRHYAPLSPEKQRRLLNAIERTIEEYNRLCKIHYSFYNPYYEHSHEMHIRNNIKKLRDSLPSMGSTQYDPCLPSQQPAAPYPPHDKL